MNTAALAHNASTGFALPIALFAVLACVASSLVGCDVSCPPGSRTVGDTCVRGGIAGTDSAGFGDGVGGLGAGTSGTSSGPVSGTNAGVGGIGTVAGGGAASGGVSGSNPNGNNGTAGLGGHGANAGASGLNAGAAGTPVGIDGGNGTISCSGSAGAAMCDAKGQLIVCNADGTVAKAESCPSPRLCQAGIVSKTCALCVPKQDFHCEGKALQVCADDGQSFVKDRDCDTEKLCNATVGMCTAATCVAGQVGCSSNTLTKCNADGTAFEINKPCEMGICDQEGVDCNMCSPGMKTCEGDNVLTCDATGQMFASMPCGSGKHCTGAGQCVACVGSDDCASLTSTCKVGMCGSGNTCAAANAPDGDTCTTSQNKGGQCKSGACQCTPQCDGKECGDNGCGAGGTCGPCPAGKQCSNFQCVACTSNFNCAGSLDGCMVGQCNTSNGTCTTVAASSTTRCGSNGKCSGGRCVECTPSCDQNLCGGDDGCGNPCGCKAGSKCENGNCVKPLWTTCSTSGFGASAECGGSSGKYGCFGISGHTPICTPYTTSGSCPSGTGYALVLYGQNCLVSCLPPPSGGTCPFPITTCAPNPIEGAEPPGFCLR